MDLSSLFGPPMVSLSAAQLAVVNELASEEGVVGVSIVGYGPGLISTVVQRGNFEGARAVPTEATVENDEQILVDFFGNTYPGTEDAWTSSLDQAEAAVADLREEIGNAIEAAGL